MADLDDVEYQAPEAQEAGGRPQEATASHRLPVAVAAGVAVLLVVGAYLWWRQPGPASGLVQTVDAPPAAAPPAATAVVDSPRYDLPPLADSDAFMRERAGELSSHPIVSTWARGAGLAANVAVVIENTSRGLSPARHLARLRPAGSFRVLERGNRVLLDPRNYQRFAPIADAVASIDPAMAAGIYTGIKPLLQMAYDELGNQEPIDRALERAMRQVLDAPVVDGDVPLRIDQRGIGYVFENPALESLPAAQKQLIRMGPANQRTLQSSIRRFAEAAGIAVR